MWIISICIPNYFIFFKIYSNISGTICGLKGYLCFSKFKEWSTIIPITLMTILKS